MAFTKEDLASIDEAIASGELTVTTDGQAITYRSIKDLKEVRRLIISELYPKRRTAFAGFAVRIDRGIR